MRIIFITFITPASENIRGTSALPYHLIKGLKNGNFLRTGTDENSGLNTYNVEIYSFNSNKLSDEKIVAVEKELGAMIKIIPLPKWYQWMFKFHLLLLRIFLKYPTGKYFRIPQKIVNDIQFKNPDLIFLYGEELCEAAKQFSNHNRIHLGPDTESLYYYRMMGQRFVMNNPLSYWKCAIMYRKYARMEREFCIDKNYTYYAVGVEDVKHLQQLNPKVQAKFLRHPHYEVSPQLKMGNGELDIKFHQPKIKILIAGRYDLYMKQDADLLNAQFIMHNSQLKEHYLFTFLGKGWEKHVESMRKSGYEVEHIKFAPNYIEEICKHDIQITPISIGTGTKGKVLDALANGLLVIGTPYAMENIAVKNDESCIEYRHPEEVVEILKDIPTNTEKYEEIANAGNKAVLSLHERNLIAQDIINNLYKE